MSDDEEPLTLSASTLSALQSFYGERDSRLKAFEDLKTAAESTFDASLESSNPTSSPAVPSTITMDFFTEDWNASQFWYTPSTASALAEQLLTSSTPSTRIACVSAPSVFVALRNILAERPEAERPQITLLEYDERFAVFGAQFARYDFAHPTRLPAELKGVFDAIIVDPPFLSADCQTKAALTVRWLAREWKRPGGEGVGVRVVACTGERMGELALRLYGPVGVRLTGFEVEHAKGLSNEFRCFANFEAGDWELLESGGSG
ncbi:N-6 adenine-specific DNA methyltransferas-like protein 2 [Trichodelitschia bisporula]|uniref:Protein-lysine N-methyltransferase EFM5 n=1 Tax=Trichodelitschia bisporula TaxID=703511 RepID=A0A6G1HUZ5_9PEZI|nr:N-6 adenine-specific DNA methyltransferas-like protein 2 [Trichodelitschia bisporula]